MDQDSKMETVTTLRASYVPPKGPGVRLRGMCLSLTLSRMQLPILYDPCIHYTYVAKEYSYLFQVFCRVLGFSLRIDTAFFLFVLTVE